MIKNYGSILMIITAILWSLGGLLIKLVPIGPLALISGRSICALCLFIPYFILQRKKEGKKVEPIKMKHYLLCSLSISTLSIFFVVATKLTTAAHAIILQFTAPFWIILIGFVFFGKKPQSKDIKAIISVLFGIILFLSHQLNDSHQLGNMFAVLSGISMAVMILYLQSSHIKYPLLVVIIANITNAIIGFPFLLKSTFSYEVLGYILIIGIFQYGISYILYIYAVKKLESIQVVILSAFEPILNPIWVYLATGESLSGISIIGAFIVLSVIIHYNISIVSDNRKSASKTQKNIYKKDSA